MKKNLAIIGASYLQLPLIEKAKEMGYITHVFAWQAGDVGELVADFFYPISIVEKEEILEICRKIGICGICSIASDLAMVTVNYVAEQLGLSGNSMVATAKSTNKHFMRQAFAAANDPSPKSILVNANTNLEDIEFTYPVIVKPVDRSGSRGIYKVMDSSLLAQAVENAMSQGFVKEALIEEFVDGQEYSVEYISFQGKHHFLAVTHKYTTGAPNFIETGHLQPAPISQEKVEMIKSVVEHALDTLELRNGASHSEVKITPEGNIRIIEIGGRMGGDCIGSDLVRYSTGYDFVKMVIQVACGYEPEMVRVSAPQNAEVRFIFTKDDLDIMEKIRKEEPDKILKIVDLHPENIGKITDSSNRAGCYIIIP